MEDQTFFFAEPAHLCFECGVCHYPNQNTLCPLSSVFNGSLEERLEAMQRMRKWLYTAVQLLEDWSVRSPCTKELFGTEALEAKTEEFLNEVY